MREQLAAALGVLAIGCGAVLGTAGPIALVVIGFLLPLLMPFLLAVLFPAVLLTAMARFLRRLTNS